MSTDCNIILTDNALKKIHSLIAQEKNKNSLLRIAVLGGGCSGFKYNFLIDQRNGDLSSSSDDDDDGEFDDSSNSSNFENRSSHSIEKNKDIIINDKNGNPVLMIDNYSAKLLNNSVIDYTENLNGSGFKVKNFLAKSQCGCGSSFSL
ncbi:MAG: heme biosynthesis protein HemY [Wolbachia endosymbiont of Meromenopon meropis]|nr:heme biosynthesis protein HemY [Wolbachia endosymbiont of Meromenopon meropis]